MTRRSDRPLDVLGRAGRRLVKELLGGRIDDRDRAARRGGFPPSVDEQAIAHQRTQADMRAQQPPPEYLEQAGPMSSTHYATRASAMQNAQPVQGAMQGAQPMPGHEGVTGPIARPSAPMLHDYPVMPGGQRPFSSDLAPSNLSSPQRSPYANAPFDPGQAASLMSPVGEQYPQTDWERAAAEFEKCLDIEPKDGPARVFAERVKHFFTEPPPADWDRAWKLDTK